MVGLQIVKFHVKRSALGWATSAGAAYVDVSQDVPAIFY
jgi:hypothetical protein